MKALVLLLLLGLMAPSVEARDTMPPEKGKFVHTVFFWLKNKDSEADRQKLYEGLTKLSQIELIETAYVGVPATTNRDVIDRSYDFSITFVFPDPETQDAYQVHPDHLKFVEEYGHLWERVVVYDAIGPDLLRE